MEGGRKRMGKKVQGLRSTNWFMQDGQGEVKNSIGNGVAKELICMSHGHELRGRGNCWREWGYQVEGGKGGKIGTTVIA